MKKHTALAPHSKEAEMMVLGCMLSSMDALNLCVEQLKKEDFFELRHQVIFSVLRFCYEKDRPADIHIVSEELKRTQQTEDAGGVDYLTSLVQFAGSSPFVEEYVRFVKNASTLRQIIEGAQRIEREAWSQPDDVADMLDRAQQTFFSIGRSVSSHLGLLVKERLQTFPKEHFLKELEHRQELFRKHGAKAFSKRGIPTGFSDLDRLIEGCVPSNLMILAARPAMGKTAFALNIAEHICLQHQKPVGIFSLEMTADQIVDRLVVELAEVPSEKIATGDINGEEYQRVVRACGRLEQNTMVIDDQPNLRINDLRTRARRMKEVYDVQFILIDYLQLISGSAGSRSVEFRQNEISEISRMLKILARELDVPILALSQLSRKVEERAGHRPLLSDLRESGSIEQDADVVMLLLRRDYYDPNDRPGMAELFVAKNRHGKTGEVDLVFQKEFAKFASYLRQEDNDDPYP